MSDAEKTEKTDAAPKPKKKSKLVPILAVVFVLLAGGGAGGYWMYSHRAGQAPAAEPKPPKSGVVDMEVVRREPRRREWQPVPAREHEAADVG